MTNKNMLMLCGCLVLMGCEGSGIMDSSREFKGVTASVGDYYDPLKYVSFKKEGSTVKANSSESYAKIRIDSLKLNKNDKFCEVAYKGYSTATKTFTDITRSGVFLVAIDTTANQAKFTSDLFSYSHGEIKNQGETFSIGFAKSYETPFMRVGKGDRANFKFELKAGQETKSNIAQTGLRFVQEIIAPLVGPEAKLVTSLNAKGMSKQAESLDKGLGGLFSKSINEYLLADQPLDVTSNDANNPEVKLGELSLSWFYKDDKPSADQEPPLCLMGKWEVKLAGATDSLFNGGDSPAQYARILNYEFIPEGTNEALTVEKYILSRPWYNEALRKMADSNANVASITAQMCNQIVIDMYNIGLTETDANLVSKAVREGMPLPSGLRNAMNTLGTGVCK